MPLLLLVLVGVPLAAGGGVLAHANLAVRRERSPLHRKLAELADTGRRPPAALFAPGIRKLADADDFGAGIARHCGCEAPRRGGLARGGLGKAAFRAEGASCSTGGCS